MNDEVTAQIKEHAVRTIAHRWFAFFEGDVNDMESHLMIFEKDIKLIHAGRYLLADGLDSIKLWLENLPQETGSHFIKSLDLKHLDEKTAEGTMKIAYQIVNSDETLSGAIIEYKVIVVFDNNNEATFRIIQKTPMHPNPSTTYKDSFKDNRLKAFVNRLLFLVKGFQYQNIYELCLDESIWKEWNTFAYKTLKNNLTISVDEMNTVNLTVGLTVRGTNGDLTEEKKINISLQDTAESYLKISALETV
ncbi:hypothetical protein AB9M93_25615 [Peribacillus frigoritolerans]|uniref:hypothetical protein n=1 Tax=Peribacillus frigoritolerans TaxID=450367 RepID=UPI0035140E75